MKNSRPGATAEVPSSAAYPTGKTVSRGWRIMKRAGITCGILVVVSALWGLSYAGGTPAGIDGVFDSGVVEIHMENMGFSPAQVTIRRGIRVRWINRDPIDHDVTSGVARTGRKSRGMKETRFPDGRFQSGLFGKGSAYEFVFKESGSFPYFCSVHPIMTGRITVVD